MIVTTCFGALILVPATSQRRVGVDELPARWLIITRVTTGPGVDTYAVNGRLYLKVNKEPRDKSWDLAEQ
jgi:hypothetical protein